MSDCMATPSSGHGTRSSQLPVHAVPRRARYACAFMLAGEGGKWERSRAGFAGQVTATIERSKRGAWGACGASMSISDHGPSIMRTGAMNVFDDLLAQSSREVIDRVASSRAPGTRRGSGTSEPTVGSTHKGY